MDKNKKERTVTCVVFAVYILLLVWLVLFKFAVRIEDIPGMRSMNLIPFYYEQENSFHLKEILYNVIVFIPAGFYFSAIAGKKNIFLGTAATAVLSFLFEAIQWICSIGATDITDLITNTFGGFLGMLLFLVMGKITLKYRMKIINTLGIIIEIFGCMLLFFILAAN